MTFILYYLSLSLSDISMYEVNLFLGHININLPRSAVCLPSAPFTGIRSHNILRFFLISISRSLSNFLDKEDLHYSGGKVKPPCIYVNPALKPPRKLKLKQSFDVGGHIVYNGNLDAHCIYGTVNSFLI